MGTSPIVSSSTSINEVLLLLWRHNGRDGVSSHQPHHSLLNRLFRRRSKKTAKLRVTGLCAGNSPVTGEFPHKSPVTRKLFPFDDVIMWPKCTHRTSAKTQNWHRKLCLKYWSPYVKSNQISSLNKYKNAYNSTEHMKMYQTFNDFQFISKAQNIPQPRPTKYMRMLIFVLHWAFQWIQWFCIFQWNRRNFSWMLFF